MIRCAACGRENEEVAARCGGCETDLAPALVEGVLASGPAADLSAPGEPASRPTAPLRLHEALAAERTCASCRTSIPPVSRFCGICGVRLDPPPLP